MNDCMTQGDAMNMNNEQAVSILIPLRDMMRDQYGCPISDAYFALDKAIEALKQLTQPNTPNTLNALDTISRQAAIDAIKKRADKARDMVGSDHPFWEGLIVVLNIVEQLPSAQPERKTGKWIKVNGKTAINCSACYHCSWSLLFEDTVKQFNFCPSCGADMRGEQNEAD